MSKELWEFFLSCGVILLDHFFLDHFFNFLLGFHIIWISVSKFSHSFLFCFLLGEMSFKSLSHKFFDFIIIIGFKSSGKIRIVLFKVSSLMRIVLPNLLYLSSFSFDLLVLLIMEQLIEHLLEILFWCSNILF